MATKACNKEKGFVFVFCLGRKEVVSRKKAKGWKTGWRV